jgi:type II secretory ATPase GspE/PulE/Tfp pilus assembly ATPase PilB-like protein
MVGEIRDAETADIAINAALTGHLLLSTFHSNDASTGIPRLLDMGAEPFLLASTLQLIMAQRLARKVCENCRVSYKIKSEQLSLKYSQVKGFVKPGDLTLYQGKGCSICHGTGYNGRIALFEIIRITPELQELILTNPSSLQVWQLAQRQGSRSMFEDGITKVLAGVTTIEEVIRVASPPAILQKK